jgi:hypothetical protein
MSTLAEIKAAICKLTPQDFARLRDWLLEHDIAAKFSSKETTEIREALAEAKAEFERGEGLSSEQIQKQFGLR